MEIAYKYTVCTQCMTFNQMPYIMETLNGLAIQEVAFPTVFCIIDDASTDGEPGLLRTWAINNLDIGSPEARHETMDYGELIEGPMVGRDDMHYVILLLKENHYKKGLHSLKQSYIKEWMDASKYTAICEGDDYWIDPCKLQKQVDYLNAHPECSYLFTDRYIDDERSGGRQEIRYQKKKYTTHDILSGFIPGLQTVMYKRELMESPILQTKGINGDRLYAYAASTMGEVHCLHEITAVYRNTGKGVSTSVSQDEFFNHVVSDMMRFHNNLGVNDWWAYLNGQSHKLGSYGAGLPRWKRLCGAYYEYRNLDSRIGVFSYIIMVLLFLKKQLYSKMNIYDPKRYNIKDN